MFDPDGESSSAAPSLFLVGGRELGAVSVVLKLWGPSEELQPFGTDSMRAVI